MESVLVAEKRDELGKADVRRLRRTGNVPVVIYGEDMDSQSLLIDSHDLEMLVKKNVSVISLKIDGKEQSTIIREIQYHPVKGQIIHVDFLALQKGHKVEMAVSIHFEGTSSGVKAGGNFSVLRNEINILVLPKDIPDSITVDVSALEIGDSIRVKDIDIENVEFLDDLEELICHVAVPKTEVEAEEAGEDALDEEENAQPEVITARKDEPEE